MMLALEMFRSVPRTVAGKAIGGRMPMVLSGFAAPLRLVTIDEPRIDRPGWARLRTRLSGICGSDLGALSGHTSLYFSAVVSLPFVPGHEVVAELLEDCDHLPAGTRRDLDAAPPGRLPPCPAPGAAPLGPRANAVRERLGGPHQTLVAAHRGPPGAGAPA